MKARKKGRPALGKTPVGLKPYLSPAAVGFLNQQKSKSAFVARLIEEAVDQVQDESNSHSEETALQET